MLADGILYWTPLILDGILTGNFNGKVVTGIHGTLTQKPSSFTSSAALNRKVLLMPKQQQSELSVWARQRMTMHPTHCPVTDFRIQH